MAVDATGTVQLVLVDLSAGVAATVIGLSLLVSVAFYLWTNLSPCGLITPAYLVLALVRSPWALLMILAGTGVLWAIMVAASRFMILYGKRLFAVTVVTGVLVQLTPYLLLHKAHPYLFPGDALSFVAPGLIVYQLVRQKKPLQTLAVTGAVSAASAALVFATLAIPV